ncbi:TetR/AcrR family transcriptional regulator [Mycobacterium shigaense]|uniref:TetR family transcriptional regulator n=1 Tax=Mycobacterium shigaense TaxID=722731 RepID=A0A1Z4EFC6_9MYCO|nr:TetR/AcrR family transcriptional regulator [Mycobacterium shigaense]MEA1122210.1 TetR/AcrR family transcriptional regulator [Mycobacterium shigaense]PRI16392.1 TetR family transcriptional regulator [Mycobacterium shigaense]BAX91654.1 TetR family transcriptional regulator [Mycobacterium shigaense]
MTTRAESAAATRRSLLEAAGTLLDLGGVEAVTLREVGARAGVSRSAAYRHFADKDSLLAVLATNALSELGDALEALVNSGDSPTASLRSGLLSLIAIGRARPHLYRLMFVPPAGDPTEARQAAERAQGLFLDIVGRITGPAQASRYGALLLTSAHGITGLDLSGHMDLDKWQTNAEELVDTLISVLPRA